MSIVTSVPASLKGLDAFDRLCTANERNVAKRQNIRNSRQYWKQEVTTLGKRLMDADGENELRRRKGAFDFKVKLIAVGLCARASSDTRNVCALSRSIARSIVESAVARLNYERSGSAATLAAMPEWLKSAEYVDNDALLVDHICELLAVDMI